MADEKTGRVRLTYGDVISIDAVQSATSTEHINALVSGSQAANGFKGYVAQSRAREISWLVVPDGLERIEIQTNRAMGSTSPVTESDVWNNVATNLSRQPEKELGVKLIEEATRIYRGTLRDLATAFQPAQQARVEGRHAANGFQERRDERQVATAAPALAQGAMSTVATTARTTKKLTEPDMRHAVREAKRAAAKPKTQRESVVPVQPVSEADARRQFRDALSDAGIVFKGDPMMDGKAALHRSSRHEGQARLLYRASQRIRRAGRHHHQPQDRPAGELACRRRNPPDDGGRERGVSR